MEVTFTADECLDRMEQLGALAQIMERVHTDLMDEVRTVQSTLEAIDEEMLQLIAIIRKGAV